MVVKPMVIGLPSSEATITRHKHDRYRRKKLAWRERKKRRKVEEAEKGGGRDAYSLRTLKCM
jgi:hypothetical protein